MNGTCPACHEPTPFHRVRFSERDFYRAIDGYTWSARYSPRSLTARFGGPDHFGDDNDVWLFTSTQGKSRYVIWHKHGFGNVMVSQSGHSGTGAALKKFMRWLGFPLKQYNPKRRPK